MFQGLAFYLAPTLSSEVKAELKRLIRKNGGVVADSPKGATQLAAYDKLDPRHANRISTDFIKDSVAFRALQDPAKYSAKIFMTELKQQNYQKRGERVQYTLEEDARMLHFARMRDWKAMGSVPLSAWEIAERDGVTSHSAQSMREHFRKQLMAKTPEEQRILLAKAAATTRARLLEQEDEAEEEQEMEMLESSRAEPSRSATPEAVTTEAKEVEGQKLSRRRTRSRKQITPLQISQRIRVSEGDSNEDITSPVPVSTSQPSSVTRAELAIVAVTTTPTTPASRSTSAVLGRSDPSTDDHSTEKQQQKRKRDTPPSGISSQEPRPSVQETVESDSEGEGREIGGIYFTSAWTTTVNDRSKRRLLQQFFEPPSRSESIPNEQIDDVSSAAHEEDGSSETSSRPLQPRVQEATEEETDVIICQLQLDTHQDLQSVVHALYYFNGDVEKAKRFLKGASPPDMWCPGDDLLLANLVVDERTDLPSVDEALARGDFASLQAPRSSDAVLERVNFLK